MGNLFAIWLPLAARFVRSHRRKSIATGGFITVGAAILVLMHAMTVGISDTMVLNTTALHTGHLFTEFKPNDIVPEAVAQRAEADPSVHIALPRYRYAGIVRHGGAASPGMIFAVDADKEQRVIAVANRIIKGSYPTSGSREALMGSGMAEALGIGPGDTISVWRPGGSGGESFFINGVFETGIDRFDKGILYIPIETMKEQAAKYSDSEVAVFLKDERHLDASLNALNLSAPKGVRYRTWTELMPDLVQLIRLNRVSTTILMVLVFALVGFGIANTFVLTIVERFRELGMLKAMGMTPSEIVFLVFLESFMVCAVATSIGILVGCGLAELTAATGIDLGSLTSQNRYFVVSGVIRPRLTLPGLAWPIAISLVVSLISSWLPARTVARKLTAEALRFS